MEQDHGVGEAGEDIMAMLLLTGVDGEDGDVRREMLTLNPHLTPMLTLMLTLKLTLTGEHGAMVGGEVGEVTMAMSPLTGDGMAIGDASDHINLLYSLHFFSSLCFHSSQKPQQSVGTFHLHH